MAAGLLARDPVGSPGSPEARPDLPDHRDQLACASAAGGSVASPSFDVSDFEEHQWYHGRQFICEVKSIST